jgi:hypothetical protein
MRERGWLPVERLAGALLALALVGVPQLLQAHEPRPVHRCHCPVREGRHDCDCPLCHAEAARAAAPTAGQATPPCHAALAAKSAPAARDRREPPDGPALSSSCGVPEGTLALPLLGQSLLPPPPPALGRVVTVERIGEIAGRRRSSPALPELPPPRRVATTARAHPACGASRPT